MSDNRYRGNLDDPINDVEVKDPPHEVDVMYVPVCERCGKPAHYDDRDERWHHDGPSHGSVTAAG
jgi:hypothetical protein